jgi:pantoate--beta-alanine ligase
MIIVNSTLDLRSTISSWKRQGLSVALVPTMGNLHAGHLKLVNIAQQKVDKVVVSIFVNPTQFGINEDFASYPRTEQEDQLKLATENADLLFLPAITDIYNANTLTTVNVSGLSDIYCGASRPGHFSGVATIVCKLFNLVQPDIAVFGLKDFQQFTVIQTMIRDLNIPIELIGVDTQRESDGLAMSSRNNFLTDPERLLAPQLYQTLCIARAAILADQKSYLDIEQQALQSLKNIGFAPDYFTICCSHNLTPATQQDKDIVILAAAKLGTTRLIDNIYFSV